MDQKRLTGSIEKTWNDSIIERLIAYVRIPNKSPQFDPNWERNGHMEAAVKLMADWCRAQPLPGSRVEVRRLPGRTPLLLVDVPGELPDTVLLYGHRHRHRAHAVSHSRAAARPHREPGDGRCPAR